MRINIKKVLQDRVPKIEKWLPNFLISAFERLIYQKEMNAVLAIAEERNAKDIDMASLTVSEIGAVTESVGVANVPLTGGVIIAANHPLGGIDGMMLISEVGKIRPDVKFIVNDILMNIPNFENVFVGVNKHGATTKQVLQEVEKIYSDGSCVLIFPAGLCSRKIDGKIQDLEWQKSFIARAQKYHLPIIPAHIDAKNTSFFYNFAMYRKKMGIKLNLEMFFLPGEMFKQKGKKVKISFGKAIQPEVLDKSKPAQWWAATMKDYIYQLKSDINADFALFLKERI